MSIYMPIHMPTHISTHVSTHMSAHMSMAHIATIASSNGEWTMASRYLCCAFMLAEASRTNTICFDLANPTASANLQTPTATHPISPSAWPTALESIGIADGRGALAWAMARYRVLHIGRVAYTHTYVKEVCNCACTEGECTTNQGP